MIIVGIDVAKDKHDCFIINSEGEVLSDVFTIANSYQSGQFHNHYTLEIFMLQDFLDIYILFYIVLM